MPFPVTYLLDQLAPSETFVRRELDQLRRRGWPVYTRLLKGGVSPLPFALRSCPDGCRWRFFRAACARVSEEFPRAPGAAGRLLRRLPQAAHLANLFVASESRLLHAHFAGVTADLAAVVSATTGLPWTCSVHAHDVFTPPPAQLYRRLRTAAGVAACSQQAADAVTAAGIAPEKVSVIHHGLPLNDFTFDTIQPDGTIFTACRLEPKKGLDTLLQACSLLVQRGVVFTCVIAGEGPLRDALSALTAKLGLTHTVYFEGWMSQEETRSRMMDASVLALPSRRMKNGDRDGIANILLEAMALGTPVVTTAAGAAAEIIADHRNGLLVPPDDPAALADALAEALASKALLIQLARAARQTIAEQFDASSTIQQLEAFFCRCAHIA
ncbi:MAG: glycosyltransferase [Verrucomicrobiota bacterium]|jgi:glycosyltransferase involved in cell wall biosynthesis|nr:glycosyltransferase [Verrucomicrobiota bacterium]